MTVVNKYRIPCTTDGTQEEAWGTAAPTKCPVNSAHTIDASGITVIQRVDDEVQPTKQVLSQAGLKISAFGFKFTATKGVETTYDYKLTEIYKLRGGEIECHKNEFGDTVTIEIIDIDNVLGYGANFVVSDYFTNWNIDLHLVGSDRHGHYEILEVSVGDAIPKDLYIRVKYNSVGGTDDVKVAINFRAYKDT